MLFSNCTMVSPFILYAVLAHWLLNEKARNCWRGVNEFYGLYLLCYANGQMYVYLIASLILLSSTSFLPCTNSSQPGWFHIETYCMEGNLDTTKIWRNWWPTKNSPNFPHPNFYTSIVKSHVNIKQIEYILGTCPTTYRVPSITLLIAMGCG